MKKVFLSSVCLLKRMKNRKDEFFSRARTHKNFLFLLFIFFLYIIYI